MNRNLHFTIVLFFIICIANAQHKIGKEIINFQKSNAIFKSYDAVFEKQTNHPLVDQKYDSDAVTIRLNQTKLAQILKEKLSLINIDIPFNDTIITVNLKQVDPYSESFKLKSSLNDTPSFDRGLHYRGIVKGDSTSIVSISFFKNRCGGIISTKKIGNLVLGRIDNQEDNFLMVIYNDHIIPSAFRFKCDEDINNKTNRFNGKSNNQVLTDRCVGLYFEIDYDLFTQNNSSITETMQWMSILFNAVQTLYFNDDINVNLSSVFIWTTPDPYVGNTTDEFLTQFIQVRPSFQGDLGQLLCSETIGLGGIAYMDALCSSVNYSFVRPTLAYTPFPLYSFTVHAVAHEFGHLLGSEHTQACVWNGNNTPIDGCVASEGNCGPAPIPADGGTIMSYCHANPVGVNFANGFGPQPSNLMRNRVNNSNCLSVDCINQCYNSSASLVLNTTHTSVTANWSLLNPANVDLNLDTFDSNSQNWVLNCNPPYTFFNLQPNTHYRLSMRTICDNGFEWIRENEFVTQADYCSGIILTDSGGINQDYQNNEDVIRVIVPTIPNSSAKIIFQTFDLEAGWDFLYVYNGSSIVAQELTGGLTGSDLPQPIESSAPDGSLTMRFISDDIITANGYSAIVECNNLSISDSNSFIDFSYYPNPSKNEVIVNANVKIVSVDIYDVKGSLTNSKEINDTYTVLDLSSLSNGTYFAKLNFELKSCMIKIIKD